MKTFLILFCLIFAFSIPVLTDAITVNASAVESSPTISSHATSTIKVQSTVQPKKQYKKKLIIEIPNPIIQVPWYKDFEVWKSIIKVFAFLIIVFYVVYVVYRIIKW